MARTRIDGDQVEDESLTGADILDGSIQRKDIDVVTAGQALIRKMVFQGAGFTNTWTGVDEGTGDVFVELSAGGFGGDFYSAFDPTESSTTSNDWVNKVSASTPPVTADGQYILIYTMEVGQSKASKQIGSRVRYRINGGPWVQVTEILNGISRANAYELRTGFTIIPTVVTGDTIQAEIDYGQTDESGIGRILNAGFISWRVS